MMTDSRVFSMRRSAVTVSTVGVIPRILQMADDLPGVSLALSLHAPNQVVIVRSACAHSTVCQEGMRWALVPDIMQL
jgi:hypothetical protein